MIREDSLFESDSATRALRTLLRLYDEVGGMPTKTTFLVELMADHGHASEKVLAFVKRAYKLPAAEVQAVYAPQCKQLIEASSMQYQCARALEACSKGDIERAESYLQKARTHVCAFKEGDYLKRDVDAHYASGKDVTGRGRLWSTGYPAWDEVLKGGFGEGESHGIAGPSGLGKSRMLVNLAVNMALAGAYVMYQTFELDVEPTYARIDHVLAEAPCEDIAKSSALRETVKRRMQDMEQAGGGIYVVKFVPDETTVDQAANFARAHARKPDVTILDYMEQTKYKGISGNRDDKWGDQSHMYKRATALAETLQCVVLLATQMTKEAYEEATSNRNIEGSGHKIDSLSSMWLMYLRGNQLESEGRFGLFGLKDRHGLPRRLIRFRLHPRAWCKVNQDGAAQELAA